MRHGDPTKMNAVSYLTRVAWHYSQGNRRSVVLYITLMVLAMALSLFAMPFVFAKIINIVQTQNVTSDSIGTLLSFLLLTLVIENGFWFLHGPARLVEQVNAFKAWVNYRGYLLKGVVTLPMAWHTDHHSGETFDKIEKGGASVYQYSEDSFETIYTTVNLCGSFTVLVCFCHLATPVVLIMMAVSAWVTMRIDSVLIPLYKQINRKENHISERIFDIVSNITTVVILRVERLVFDAIMESVVEPLGIVKRSNWLNEVKWYLTSMCCKIMTILVLGTYFVAHWQQQIPVVVGDLYLLIHYLNNMGQVLFQFTKVYGDMQKRKARVVNAEELAAEFVPKNFSNHVLPPDWKQIRVKGLRFSYNEDGGTHLCIPDLVIKRGARIACVGKTGGGKSTFLKLMHGDLYHPQELELFVDGVLVPDGFAGIGQAVSLIPQDPEIFARSIEFNITCGAKLTPQEIDRCMEMALFSEVAAKLPRGLDSEIKEKGVNLSGGQKQRLAVARGIAASLGKQIVLLDEPTASLDKVTEEQVYSNITREFGDKNIFAAIHGVHLLHLFDLIYVFDEGEIVGIGSIEELVANCPKFAKLWEAAHRTHKVRRVMRAPEEMPTDRA